MSLSIFYCIIVAVSKDLLLSSSSRLFLCLMSLFQGHVACVMFTLHRVPRMWLQRE